VISHFNSSTQNTTQDRQIVFDDISVLICGEKLPSASLFIEKDPALTDLSNFPCEEKKEIDLSDLNRLARRIRIVSLLFMATI
jgi:hypothetical protein